MIASKVIKFGVPHRLRDSAGSVIWACEEVIEALRLRGVTGHISHDRDGASIIVMRGELDGVEDPDFALPSKPESMALFKEDDAIVAWGADSRGLVYALTELADRVRTTCDDDNLFGDLFPTVESPTAAIRSIARLFCAEHEDKIWFYSKSQWRDYLSMLATNRFNRFSLTLGMGYNYPYHNPWITDVYFYFPYPYFFAVDGYDIDVAELSATERSLNLETLKFIGEEAARRGLEFQLALWTQRYDFDDVPRANYTVRGVTDENLAPYCRDAITRLLMEVPQITGLTFRVHVEGGIAEGDYAFWDQAFKGVAKAGRPVEIDMHGKGLDFQMIDLARSTGMPITASPKYLAEHMGLPYHQSAIREEEYPPETARSVREQLSEGSRKFLRYSYGDLLRRDKDYKVVYRIWPGTQRVLLWADPAFAAGYARSSMFAGSDGVEWCEPQSFKGRMGTGIPGQRFSYAKHRLATDQDWRKYAYQYRVWGRLLYKPDSPRQSWTRALERDCGDAAIFCEQGLSSASRILPLVTLAHGPSASNNHYWPEIYTNLPFVDGAAGRAYAFDMRGPTRFGNAPTFDPILFANAREYVDELLSGKVSRRYTPLDVADWLDELADGCDASVLASATCRDRSRAEVERILLDIEISGGIARYFAQKFRAACWAELFIAKKATCLLSPLIDHAERSVSAWKTLAGLSKGVYHDDMTYGPQSWLRGSWHSRLPEMEAELLDLEALRGYGGTETVAADEHTRTAMSTLQTRIPVVSAPGVLTHDREFVGGKPLRVVLNASADEAPVMHYRHINQAERWQSVEMREDDDGYVAAVPADYTASDYHLQLFVSFRENGQAKLAPGLNPDLANEPYATVLHEKNL